MKKALEMVEFPKKLQFYFMIGFFFEEYFGSISKYLWLALIML